MATPHKSVGVEHKRHQTAVKIKTGFMDQSLTSEYVLVLKPSQGGWKIIFAVSPDRIYTTGNLHQSHQKTHSQFYSRKLCNTSVLVLIFILVFSLTGKM